MQISCDITFLYISFLNFIVWSQLTYYALKKTSIFTRNLSLSQWRKN